MQHADPNNTMLANAAGEEMWQAMIGSRRELVKRPVTFQARGISSLISRGQQLKTLLGILSVIGQNDMLMQAFLKEIDIGKLVDRIMMLSGVDKTKLSLSQREKMVASLAQPIQQAQDQTQGAPAPAQPGQDMVGQAVS